MAAEATMVAEAFGPFAIPATPQWIRAMVPEGVVGAYLLLKGERPFYVGRSDNCLANRLCGHELLDEASHVVWEVCRDPVRAFHCEAFWYDRSRGTPSLRNRVHPARPAGFDGECPFCSISAESIRAAIKRGRTPS